LSSQDVVGFPRFVSLQVTCRPVWHNSVTGEVCLTPPVGVKEMMRVAEEFAGQREELHAKMAARKRK